MKLHGLIWLVVLAIAIVLVPVLASKQTIEKVLQDEYHLAQTTYGEGSAETVWRNAVENYRFISDKAFLKQINGALVKIVDNVPRLRGGKVLGVWDIPKEEMRGGVEGPIMSVLLLMWRIENYLLWCLYVAPLAMALSYDGWMTRKARLEENYYSSPARYNAYWHIMIAAFAVSLLATFAPVSQAILLYPVTLVGLAWLMRAIIANVQASA